MLGDDVIEGTKSGIATLGHAVKNAAKGALLFAAVAAVAVVAVGAGTMLLGGATAASGLAADAGVLGSIKAFATVMAKPAMEWATAGAVGGAIVAGVGSLIPGSEEGFSLKKLFARKPKAQEPTRAPQQEAAVQQSTTPAQQEAPTQEKTHRAFSHHKPQSNHTNQTSSHTVVDNSQNTQIVHADTHTVNNYHTASQGNAGEAPTPVVANPTGDSPSPPVAAVSQPQQPTSQEEPTPTTSAPLLNTEAENPLYRPGKGAELMQRGNERSSEMATAR